MHAFNALPPPTTRKPVSPHTTGPPRGRALRHIAVATGVFHAAIPSLHDGHAYNGSPTWRICAMYDGPHRKTMRSRGHDYRAPCCVHVTLCTHHRQLLFGTVTAKGMVLNTAGLLVNHALNMMQDDTKASRSIHTSSCRIICMQSSRSEFIRAPILTDRYWTWCGISRPSSSDPGPAGSREAIGHPMTITSGNHRFTTPSSATFAISI